MTLKEVMFVADVAEYCPARRPMPLHPGEGEQVVLAQLCTYIGVLGKTCRERMLKQSRSSKLSSISTAVSVEVQDCSH
jgi:hypothetical protein